MDKIDKSFRGRILKENSFFKVRISPKLRHRHQLTNRAESTMRPMGWYSIPQKEQKVILFLCFPSLMKLPMHFSQPFIRRVCVDLRCSDRGVAEHLLNRANVRAIV